jgi:hypothetical protein
MVRKNKKPASAFAQKRALSRVSLAVFVTRPQAEHQIGAMMGFCPSMRAKSTNINGL